jgi:DNA-binding SARP family transcriptional activator
VESNGAPLRFPRKASEALVALLALRRGRGMGREALAETLWPGISAESSRNRFDVTLSAARRALEPEAGPRGPFRVLLSEAGLIRLGSGDRVSVDLEAFEQESRACAHLLDRLSPRGWSPGDRLPQGEMKRALVQIERAIAAYGGDLLPALAGAGWTTAERDRLRDRFHRLLLAAGTSYLALGRKEDAAQAARRVLSDDPLSEEAVRILLRAQVTMGARQPALRAYRRFRRGLARELGIRPSPETVSLVQELLER